MQLVSPFLPMLQGGVTLTLRISVAAGNNIQIDILPQGKDSATGVALPPKALVGTAEELDQHLEHFLQKYAASVCRVADVVAAADAELKTIEETAAAQARQAVADRRKAKSPAPSTHKNPRNNGAEHEEDHEDEADDTLLLSTPGQTPGAAAPPAADTPSDAINRDLFVR